MKKMSWTIALLLALGLGLPAHAQDEGLESGITDGAVTDETMSEEHMDEGVASDEMVSESESLASESGNPNIEVETSRSGTTTRVMNPDGSSTTVRSNVEGDVDAEARSMESDLNESDLNQGTASGATGEANEYPAESSDFPRESSPGTTSGATSGGVESEPGMAPLEPAPVAAESRAESPRWWPSNIRVIPTAGASSFTSSNKVDFDNFEDGFTAGAFLDFGGNTWVFETGILALQTKSTTDVAAGTSAFDVDNWGIPLLAKVNFSGKPNSTVYMKAGVMPFQSSGTTDDFDVLGVAGLGAAIPLFRNTALTLEGSYNRLFDESGPLGAYTGVSFLGGLSFAM